MDAVKAYKRRREQRIKTRMDADEDGRWVTTEKKHKVHFNESGEPDKGNPHVISAMKDTTGEKEVTVGGETRKVSGKVYNAVKSAKWGGGERFGDLVLNVPGVGKAMVRPTVDGDEIHIQPEGGTMRKVVTNNGQSMGYSQREARKYLMIHGKKDSESAETKSESYEGFSASYRMGGRKYASADEVKKVRETVSRFIKEAKEGDVYEVGGGFGSAGGSRFQVTNRRGKPAMVWLDSDGRRKGNVVQMSRANVEKYIANGAKKVK